jgi:hypothetical protein
MTVALAVPQGFPDTTGPTNNRRVLDAIVAGLAPLPPSTPGVILPRPQTWSYGSLSGTAQVPAGKTWTPGLAFGGYLTCLVDEYGGLVMLSVLPDSATFLTAGLAIDLHGPMRAAEIAITAEVVRLTGRDASVEVTLAQHDRIVSLATIRHVIRR